MKIKHPGIARDWLISENFVLRGGGGGGADGNVTLACLQNLRALHQKQLDYFPQIYVINLV